MIHINLLDDINIHQTEETPTAISIDSYSKTMIIDVVVKIFLIVAPSLTLYGWHFLEKVSQDARQKQLEAEQQSIDDQIAKQNVQYNAIKELQKEKIKIDSLIEHFAQIVAKRTVALNALNDIHAIIPEGAWLTKIEINQDGQVVFFGESEPSDIQNFTDNLNEESSYYKNAKIDQVDSSKEHYRAFQISSEFITGQENDEAETTTESETATTIVQKDNKGEI